MAYFDREQTQSEEYRRPDAVIQTVIAAIVRIVGLAVLFVGLWIGLKVILEAWALYDTPERIGRFATAIEKGSNLDKIFSATVERMSTPVATDSTSDESTLTAGTSAASGSVGPALRLSYFAAWFIVMMLMLIIGSLAMSAITAGGRLALYDSEVKKYSREVVREFARLKRAA